MSHIAMLRAVKQRTLMKRNGSMPEFHYLQKPKPILGVIRRNVPIQRSATAARNTRNRYRPGCNAECFCCSKIGCLRLGNEDEFPPWETELGIDNMVYEKRCHSRLNHRRQYSGIYKRKLDGNVFDKDYLEHGMPIHCYDTSAPQFLTQPTSFRTTQRWSSNLRHSSSVPSLRF